VLFKHHELFGLDNPVSQQSLSSTKGYRPATIAKATQAKDHAGLGRIHPKDRDDASDIADQHGWCAAKPLADFLGDENLVGGYAPGSRDLIPGHHLGAITLADALDQGPPLGKLLGRGRRRGALPRSCKQHIGPPAWSPAAPHNFRGGPGISADAKRRPAHLRASIHSCDYFPQHLSRNHNRNHH
jgi:hypothetical protein